MLFWGNGRGGGGVSGSCSAAVLAERDDFAVGEFLPLDGEADEGALFVPSLHARCSGVDVQEIECLVGYHLQYMGVSGDEEIGRGGIETALDGAVVVARIAADVLHQDVYLFAAKPQYLGVSAPNVLAIDVSVDGAE